MFKIFFKRKEHYYVCANCKNVFEQPKNCQEYQIDFDGFETVLYYECCPACESKKYKIEYGDIVMAKLREGWD